MTDDRGPERLMAAGDVGEGPGQAGDVERAPEVERGGDQRRPRIGAQPVEEPPAGLAGGERDLIVQFGVEGGQRVAVIRRGDGREASAAI